MSEAAEPAAAALSPRLPLSDAIAWGCLAVASLGLLVGLGQFWWVNFKDYADRFLVLVGAGWAASQLLPAALAAPIRPRPWIGLPLVAVGAAALPAALYLEARVGGRTLLLWWQAAALLLAAMGLILTRHGWPRLRVMAFPLLVPVFALPLPTAVEGPLQVQLKDITTQLAATGLRGLGQEVDRIGVVLRLRSGDLGMTDACSGIRSLTTLPAIAAFVAFLNGFGPIRGLLLLALTLPVVLAVNVFRVILTGLIQTYIGAEYATGNWHEGLGFAMVLLGLVVILGMAHLIGPRAAGAVPAANPPGTWPEPTASGWAAAGILLVAALGGAGAVATARTATASAVEIAPLERLPLDLPGWRGQDMPIADQYREMLVFDAALYRKYTDNLGQQADVWVIYWTAASAQKGNHNPEACGLARGFSIVSRGDQSIAVPDRGEAIPAAIWEFALGGDGLYVLHWVQEGPRVISVKSDSPATSFGWVKDLLLNPDEAPAPRLMILIGMPANTALAKSEAVKLGGRIAGEIYKVCPWADPRAAHSDDSRRTERSTQVP